MKDQTTGLSENEHSGGVKSKTHPTCIVAEPVMVTIEGKSTNLSLQDARALIAGLAEAVARVSEAESALMGQSDSVSVPVIASSRSGMSFPRSKLGAGKGVLLSFDRENLFWKAEGMPKPMPPSGAAIISLKDYKEEAEWLRILAPIVEMEEAFNSQPKSDAELAEEDAIARQLAAIDCRNRAQALLLRALSNPELGTLLPSEVNLKRLLEKVCAKRSSSTR